MFAAAPLCLPAWHWPIANAQAAGRRPLSSCATVESGGESYGGYFRYVACSPAELRGQASRALGREISQDAYTLARHMASEHGSGTPEEKMLLALSTLAQARRRSVTPTQLLACTNKLRRCVYGPIHPPDTWRAACKAAGLAARYCTAPFGRWAATSLDPALDDVLVAELALSGRVGDWAQGADDQFSGRLFLKYDRAGRIEQLTARAQRGQYWIGYLPGVNHLDVFAFRTRRDVPWQSPLGQQLILAAVDALERPVPNWAALPACPPSGGRARPWILVAASLGLAGLVGFGIAYAASEYA